MDNMEIYNKFRKVPENALKAFDNGNFKGTDINSMWRIKCLTEQFGVVGHGWTVKVVKLWTEEMKASGETYAFAEIEMKVKIDGEWGEPFTATGGNKLETYVKSKDYYKGSDEAYKMAVTDAFGVACKYLGIGADVYWENDKTKYTKEKQVDKNQSNKKPDLPFPEASSAKTGREKILKTILQKDVYVERLRDKTVSLFGQPDFDKLNDLQFKKIVDLANEFAKKAGI